MQSSSDKSIELDSPVLQASKPSNIFEMLSNDVLEAEDKLESLAMSEETTFGLQAPPCSFSQTTDEQNYIEDDPLAEIIEIFMIVLVSGNLRAVVCGAVDAN